MNVHPWRARRGHNWEEVEGSWAVALRDRIAADSIDIDWELSLWGWGVDAWSLARAVVTYSGNIVSDAAVNPGRYSKPHTVKLTQSQGIRVGYAGHIPYGRDGGLTRVHLNVKATARRGGKTVTVEEGTAVYGLST